METEEKLDRLTAARNEVKKQSRWKNLPPEVQNHEVEAQALKTLREELAAKEVNV